MSTPEERIRKAVEQAQREKAEANAKAQQEEAARERTAELVSQRAGALAEKCVTRARELAVASGMVVHIVLEMHEQEKMDPGFLLRIGRPSKGMRGIRVVPKADGWEATIHDGGTQSRIFPDDAYFERSLDEILLPLVQAAAVAIAKQEEQPGEER